jgi:hypothetical protein
MQPKLLKKWITIVFKEEKLRYRYVIFLMVLSNLILYSSQIKRQVLINNMEIKKINIKHHPHLKIKDKVLKVTKIEVMTRTTPIERTIHKVVEMIIIDLINNLMIEDMIIDSAVKAMIALNTNHP